MSNPIPRQEYIRSGTVESLNVTGELKYQGVPVAPGGGTDEKAKVSSNDTTPGYLDGKLVAGSGITLTQNSDGGDETLTITSADTNDAVKVSSNDTTPGDLEAKLVAGTNITLTTNNDGGDETLTIAAAGGVTGFTGSQNTASPNNTVNASRLLVDATSTNADFVAEPKGTGALLGLLPDGTATGGNKRGIKAVDLQLLSLVSDQVASGSYSALIGGFRNKATGTAASVVSGRINSVSGNYSGIIAGDSCNVTGNTSLVAASVSSAATGEPSACVSSVSCTASGVRSFIAASQSSAASGQESFVLGGQGSTASGFGSYVLGQNSDATQTFAVASGNQAVANRLGQSVRAIGFFATKGDWQHEHYLQAFTTTTDAQTELTNNKSAGGATNRIGIASDATYTFSGLVTARRTDADNESAGWEIKGVIDNNAGTTALVGSATVTALGDDSSGTWLVAVEADNTNDALVIKVTGENSKTIRWGATVTLMKVAG